MSQTMNDTQRRMVRGALAAPACLRSPRPPRLPDATIACLGPGEVVLDTAGVPHVVLERTEFGMRLALRTGKASYTYVSDRPWAWVHSVEELAWVVA